ncbi:MAG: LysM peptidoglycan-binding domain-containing protein [Chloroflexota bacterium]
MTSHLQLPLRRYARIGLGTLLSILFILALSGCYAEGTGPATTNEPTEQLASQETAIIATKPVIQETATLEVIITEEIPSPPPAATPIQSPTPNPTRPSPFVHGVEWHQVGYGETLGYIAVQYDTTIEKLMEANGIENPNQLSQGQTIMVPAMRLNYGPIDKLLPDSEVVLGPASSQFDVDAFVLEHGGYLSYYTEIVEGKEYTGAEIVEVLASQFSVSPRLLLALLEFKSGWVTLPYPAQDTLYYPMGQVVSGWDGLFIQLSWTANQLNHGFYQWDANRLYSTSLQDGIQLAFHPSLNAGTVAIQHFLSLNNWYELWQHQVTWDGSFMAVYHSLFGDPFSYQTDPLIPPDLTQPEFTLPWRDGKQWYLSSAPHSGWGTGGGWAALDFVPEGEDLGCFHSDAWVNAIASGVVIESHDGRVVVDLDGDGFVQTGWTILYMHVAERDRVPVGEWVATGDKIGHPSCEGGFSNGTHLHIARRYNGRWMEAAGDIPFVMDGWVPESYGTQYDGVLRKGEIVREAYGSDRIPEMNGILAGPIPTPFPWAVPTKEY